MLCLLHTVYEQQRPSSRMFIKAPQRLPATGSFWRVCQDSLQTGITLQETLCRKNSDRLSRKKLTSKNLLLPVPLRKIHPLGDFSPKSLIKTLVHLRPSKSKDQVPSQVNKMLMDTALRACPKVVVLYVEGESRNIRILRFSANVIGKPRSER